MLSGEDLEQYFAAVADAKNALQLRKSVVEVDIGVALEGLLPKLSLCEKDGATLEILFQEMRSIKLECLTRSLHLNFFFLEFYRCSLPFHRPSVLEQYGSLFSDMERVVGQRSDAQRMAQSFMDGPSCVTERRMPLFSGYER
jgi:hypothetical protein